MDIRKAAWLPLALYLGLGMTAAQARFPDHAITLIVPFSAGGGFDTLARKLTQPLSKELGVPVVVKNTPGSGGRTGSIELFRSKPDGYTIGFPHMIPFITDHALFGRRPPINYRKFSVIRMVATGNNVLYVAKKSPIKNFDDLKNTKRVLKFTNTGIGSNAWVSMTALSHLANFKASFVFGYRSLVAAALGVVRGDADGGVAGYHQLSSMMDEIRAIVYFHDKRSPKFPNAPTVVELGYPKLADLATPYIVAAPPATPEAELTVIGAAMKKAITSADFAKWANDAGYVVADKGPKDTAAALTNVEAIYKDVAPLVKSNKSSKK